MNVLSEGEALVLYFRQNVKIDGQEYEDVTFEHSDGVEGWVVDEGSIGIYAAGKLAAVFLPGTVSAAILKEEESV